jgi:hypothetical protein
MARTKIKQGLEICTLNDLIFPVEMHDNPRNTNSEYSKVVTGIVNGEEIDLNYCSQIYQLVPNAEIFPKVEEIFRRNNIAFSVTYKQLKNAMFFAEYVVEEPDFAYRISNTNDVIKFRFEFQHSYNGLWKYHGLGGFYRLVCSNGLTIPVKEMNKYNLQLTGKHTAAILHSVEEFQTLLLNVASDLKTVKTEIVSNYELLGGRMVTNVNDRITEVLKAGSIISVENSKFNTVNDILNRINREANDPALGYGGKVNDWLIYNGVNQYINDNNLNIASPEKRRTTDSKVLEYMLEYA